MFYIIEKPWKHEASPKNSLVIPLVGFLRPPRLGFQPRLQNAQFYIRGHIFNQRWIPVIQGPEHPPPPPTPTDPIEPPPLHFSAMDEGEKEEKEKEEEEKDRKKKKLAILFGFQDPPPSPTAKIDPLPSCFGGLEQGRRRISFFQQLMNY